MTTGRARKVTSCRSTTTTTMKTMMTTTTPRKATRRTPVTEAFGSSSCCWCWRRRRCHSCIGCQCHRHCCCSVQSGPAAASVADGSNCFRHYWHCRQRCNSSASCRVHAIIRATGGRMGYTDCLTNTTRTAGMWLRTCVWYSVGTVWSPTNVPLKAGRRATRKNRLKM